MKRSRVSVAQFEKRLIEFRKKLESKEGSVDVKPVLDWLEKKRKAVRSKIEIVTIPDLRDWFYSKEEGIVRHKKGTDHFFSVQGVFVENAVGTEVLSWNQPILVQKAGGFLVILCQEIDGVVKFLLQAKFEAGNINRIQLAPTIQATTSNLSQHHGGRKPLFSNFLDKKGTILIYSAKHNEEGSRFWQKSNVNAIVLLGPKEELAENENFIWLTLPQIKKLFLYDNVVNPFVKTILSPL